MYVLSVTVLFLNNAVSERCLVQAMSKRSNSGSGPQLTPANKHVDGEAGGVGVDDQQQGVQVKSFHQQPEEVGHHKVVKENQSGLTAHLQQQQQSVLTSPLSTSGKVLNPSDQLWDWKIPDLRTNMCNIQEVTLPSCSFVLPNHEACGSISY